MAYAAQFLAEPLRQFHATGGKLTYEQLSRIHADAGVPLDDVPARWRDGLAAGELFKMYFALAHTDPVRASWENAIKLVGTAATAHGASASRSAASLIGSEAERRPACPACSRPVPHPGMVAH